NLSLLLARAPEHDAVSPLVSGLTWALETPARSHCEPLVIALPEGRERLQVLRLLSEFQQHPVGRLPWCPSLTDQTDKTANVLFVRTKRAFNAAGVIHLPADSSVALLAHELAHTAGLADEYPMREELANDFCAGNYDHPATNVVVTASQTMSSEELQSLWQRLPWQQEVDSWQLLGEKLGDGLWRLGSSVHLEVGLF